MSEQIGHISPREAQFSNPVANGYQPKHIDHNGLVHVDTTNQTASFNGSSINRIEVANRLPVKVIKKDGKVIFERTIGGMAAAVDQANKNRINDTDPAHSGAVVLIGWPGAPEEEGLDAAFKDQLNGGPYRMEPVWLTPEEERDYYGLVANRSEWPVHHRMANRADYTPEKYPEAWKRFVEANTKFAEKALSIAGPNDEVRIHDYHLPLVARELKRRGYKGIVSSFLHIPFAPPQEFFTMPHAQEILDGLLYYDFIGLQTRDDRNYLAASVKRHYPEAKISGTDDGHLSIEEGEKKVKIGAIPISIDSDFYKEIANKPEVEKMAQELRERHGDRFLVFLAGRRDYTKGFVESLVAYYIALKNNPSLKENIVYLLAAPPSRDTIPAYQKYSKQIDRWVTRINGTFGSKSWQPVVLYNKGLNQDQMAAHYKVVDAVLAGSRRDGQNLVVKEGVAVAKPDCVIMMSRGVGASNEFGSAIFFDPTDIREQSRKIIDVVNMPPEEKRRRMEENRRALAANQVSDWDRSFWNAALSSR